MIKKIRKRYCGHCDKLKETTKFGKLCQDCILLSMHKRRKIVCECNLCKRDRRRK